MRGFWANFLTPLRLLCGLRKREQAGMQRQAFGFAGCARHWCTRMYAAQHIRYGMVPQLQVQNKTNHGLCLYADALRE